MVIWDLQLSVLAMLNASVGQFISVSAASEPASESGCQHSQLSSHPPSNLRRCSHQRSHTPPPKPISSQLGSAAPNSTTSSLSTSPSPSPFHPSSSHSSQVVPHTDPVPQPASYPSSSSSSAPTVNPSLVHDSQNDPPPAQTSGPPISAVSMTSLPKPCGLPDRDRSADCQHPLQNSLGFNQAGFPLSNTPSGLDNDHPSGHSSPRLHPTYRSLHSLGPSEIATPSRIQVHGLSHIRSFANEEILASSRRFQAQDQGNGGRCRQDVGRQYEISSMPVTDIIEMVAGLLTKITTTNDQQHQHSHQSIPPVDNTRGISAQTTSVLAFHGKNVPSITILSYLSRIHKYCPTTYEVFLSLLVYFDRMTEMANTGFIHSLQQRSDQYRSGVGPHSSSSPSFPSTVTSNRPTTRDSIVTPPSSIQMRARDTDPPSPSTPSAIDSQSIVPSSTALETCEDDILSLPHYFVVDSFNIHRLVIAGVTCASKFFSDVFYTNSRYAKVGGLPLLELNHLELQFLLLNDFRLAVPVEELEAYGTMLVEFYAREVVAQQQQQLPQQPQSPGESQDSFSMTGRRAKEGPHIQRCPIRGEFLVQGNVSLTPTPP
ncbi:pho85 cyclin [Histoplasma ohiense]|nr:pho85 cyclin [Histoplasma ohiense (nom. inval.)]